MSDTIVKIEINKEEENKLKEEENKLKEEDIENNKDKKKEVATVNKNSNEAESESNENKVKCNVCKCCIMEWGMVVEQLLIILMVLMDIILILYLLTNWIEHQGWYLLGSFVLTGINFIGAMLLLNRFNEDLFFDYLLQFGKLPPKLCHWTVYKGCLTLVSNIFDNDNSNSNPDRALCIKLLIIIIKGTWFYILSLLLFPILMLTIIISIFKLINDGKNIRKYTNDKWIIFMIYLTNWYDIVLNDDDINNVNNIVSENKSATIKQGNKLVHMESKKENNSQETHTITKVNGGLMQTDTVSHKNVNTLPDYPEFENILYNQYILCSLHQFTKRLNWLLFVTHDIIFTAITILLKAYVSLSIIIIYILIKLIFLIFHLYKGKKLAKLDDIRFELKETQIHQERKVFNQNTNKWELIEYKQANLPTINITTTNKNGDIKKSTVIPIN